MVKWYLLARVPKRGLAIHHVPARASHSLSITMTNYLSTASIPGKSVEEDMSAVARSVLGSTPATARKRAIGLYRAWYRAVPTICETFTLPVTIAACRTRLREKFEQNKEVKDVRVIDMLVVKGKLELEETLAIFKQTSHVMRLFDDPSAVKNNKDFLTKFLDNN